MDITDTIDSNFCIMKKYLVRFTTVDDDYDKEWCHANSKEEAKEIMLDDHWNIKEIISVEEL